MRHGELAEQVSELGHMVVVLARVMRDNGQRTGLDEVITTLGFDRSALEAELDADHATGH